MLSFSGCNVPLYTKYQIKKYLSTTDKDFQDTTIKFKNIDSALASDYSETAKIKEAVDSGVSNVEKAKENLNKQKPLEAAQELHLQLTNYYKDANDILSEMKIMFDFLAVADKSANDLSESANKLPENFDNSTSKLIKEFSENQKESNDQLEILKNQNVPDYFYQAKISLSAVLEAYSEYLTSVIKGLKQKNNRYFDVDQFVRQMDDGMSEFTDQIETIERKGEFSKRRDELTSQEEQVNQLISQLKSKYKI